MSLTFDFDDSISPTARMKVIGVGGAGIWTFNDAGCFLAFFPLDRESAAREYFDSTLDKLFPEK